MNKFFKRYNNIVAKKQLFRSYLSNIYAECINDLQALNFQPNFSKDNFTALLCGTSGDITSEIFVKFILSKSENPKIIILDISEEPLKKSKICLSEKYPNINIEYCLADARAIPLPSNTIDYIETDALLNFFDKKDMLIVLREWSRILNNEGFITTRLMASNNYFRRLYIFFLFVLARIVIGISYKNHTLKTSISNIEKANLKYINGGTSKYYKLQRFSMIKK